jgi:lysozyme family protein
MADFKIAQAKVKKHEGGYTANPKDLGNWLAVNGAKFGWAKKEKGTGKIISPIGGSVILVGTNFGVAAPTLAAWYGRTVTADEMKSLPYATAEKIFKNSFWDLPFKGDQIKDQSLAEIIYDANIQHSPQAVGKILSDSLGTSVKVPLSASVVTAINNSNAADLFEKIKTARINYYNSLNDPEFAKGWANRIKSYVYSGAQVVKQAAAKATESAKSNPGTTVAGVATLFFLGWGFKKVFIDKPKQKKQWTQSTSK